MAALLAALMVLSGCGDSGKKDNGKPQGSEPQAVQQQEQAPKTLAQEIPEPEDTPTQKAEEQEGTPTQEAQEPEGTPTQEVKEPESAAPTLNQETVAYAREEVVTSSSVNVRTAPSTDSEEIGRAHV